MKIEEALKIAKKSLPEEVYGSIESNLLYDVLTGIPNRLHFENRLSEMREKHSRTGRPFILGLVDIAGQHSFNNKYGQDQGDILLQETALFLENLVRGYDHVARIGGDEFGLLIDNDSDIRPRLRHELESSPNIVVCGEPLVLAYGFAMYTGNLHQTMRYASRELSKSKKVKHETFPHTKRD
jgi:diguanylate cyclase (GGDEF)-like protein